MKKSTALQMLIVLVESGVDLAMPDTSDLTCVGHLINVADLVNAGVPLTLEYLHGALQTALSEELMLERIANKLQQKPDSPKGELDVSNPSTPHP